MARTSADFQPSERVRIGAEVEWLVYQADDFTRRVTAQETAAIADGPLSAKGSITIEPGGQLELITQPADSPSALVAAIDIDTEVLVERFAAEDLWLVPVGLDPIRPAHRSLHLPRYVAMEQHFKRWSPWGLDMMNRTASFQLSIDFGVDPTTTWKHAHALAPLLAAMFANSPTASGQNYRPVSNRQQIWAATDPSRTNLVGSSPNDWFNYALDARVMLHHSHDDATEISQRTDTFGSWLKQPNPPTSAELELHLTTLFPPLRPRGFLELRMIDALPRTGRLAAIAVVWAALNLEVHAGISAEAAAIATSVDDAWERAVHVGLEDPDILAAATSLLDLVANRLDAAEPDLAEACRQWRAHISDGALPQSIDDLLRPEPR